MDPFPVFVSRQLGSRKWDADGHEFVDYWCGHGAMLLGHSHPAVVEAVQEQATRGTHAGGCHELEVRWGELVERLVPSAERVRFTGSGTEATLMALRLARMATGKPKFLKFFGHFHGWHDAAVAGSDPPYDSPKAPGVTDAVTAMAVVIPPNDAALVERTLAADPDIGAVILEPTGGHWGAVPIRGPFLHDLRAITTRLGRLLIFDEVITGFRVSPGGAQAYYGVMPDLTSLAKILAGGLPGGCLAGRADILNQIETRPGKPKMRHPGTYNGNPLSAAAGVAALDIVATRVPCDIANETGMVLRNKLNAAFAARNLPWLAYGDFSMFRIIPNYAGPRPPAEHAHADGEVPYGGDLNKLDGPGNPKLRFAFRQAMLLHGVDMPGLGGWLSAAHTAEDIEKTVAAAAASAEALKAEGVAAEPAGAKP